MRSDNRQPYGLGVIDVDDVPYDPFIYNLHGSLKLLGAKTVLYTTSTICINTLICALDYKTYRTRLRMSALKVVYISINA